MLLSSLPKKKKSVRLKERRIRDSYRLRKLVTPKHALLAINELRGVNISTFTYTMTPVNGQPSFLAEATIDGLHYKGTGRSKNAAKSNICDQALRDIMLKKMQATSKAVEEDKPVPPEDEVPIVTLVSYAIHKLFADWESEGYCLKCARSKTPGQPDPCSCTEVTTLQTALKKLTQPPPQDLSEMINAMDDDDDGEEDDVAGSDQGTE